MKRLVELSSKLEVLPKHTANDNNRTDASEVLARIFGEVFRDLPYSQK